MNERNNPSGLRTLPSVPRVPGRCREDFVTRCRVAATTWARDPEEDSDG